MELIDINELSGFEFEEFGGTSVCLNTLPQQISMEDAESVFTELVGQMIDEIVEAIFNAAVANW